MALEVNLRERVTHMPPPSTINATYSTYSGFETRRRCHQKSETGVSVAPKIDMGSIKILVVHFHELCDDSCKVLELIVVQHQGVEAGQVLQAAADVCVALCCRYNSCKRKLSLKHSTSLNLLTNYAGYMNAFI